MLAKEEVKAPITNGEALLEDLKLIEETSTEKISVVYNENGDDVDEAQNLDGL